MVRASSLALLAFLVVAPPLAAKDAEDVRLVDVPSEADLVAPPRVAAGEGRVALALTVAGGIDVVVGDERDAAFGDPVHAVRRADLMAGGRRGARIAVGRGSATQTAGAPATLLLAAITRHDMSGGGDLLAWRSADGGATWSDAVRVSDVPGCAAERLFDLAALGDGRFVVVWLDIREKGTRLRADFSLDGAKWGDDVVAYESPGGSICECCHPCVAPAAGSGAVVAFRNSVKGDRDVWTMRLARGATTFEPAVKSGRGSWRIAACPMAGPALALRGDEVVCAWRREAEVFLAAGSSKERGLGIGTEPELFSGRDGVHALWTLKDALLHLAPGRAAPATIARNAAFPCAAGAADQGRPGFVAWLDTATRRARLAIVP